MYEVVIQLPPEDAQKVIDAFDTVGPAAAIREMELFHWPGHHITIRDDQLSFDDDDIVFSDNGPYLGWINNETVEAGLLYKIPH